MRWSRTLIATLRDDPQDAEIVSHKLLLRAGLARKLSGGLYTFMPLGLRALHKVSQIIREEMNRAGAQEILMPALQPSELWERSGRLATMGPGMFRLKDRAERLMALGPTHEEVVTQLVASEISSYRQLPCTLYQIQTKFRDEIRPRFGLMRAKEFIMKDAYSFDTSLDTADASYQTMYDAYVRIFRRCGLEARPVEADTGDIGGKWSHEFMVLAESGEDGIVDCPACGYAANQERAERACPDTPPAAQCPAAEPVSTPAVRTIDDLTAFFKCDASRFIKTLVCLADGKPVAALVPGDRDLNEHK
ncbi:MAG: proline--tRNA ligase, partial [Kiritimatiellae bacterium]|nr:proline--tRNA ligase [Kiritimatiellia bacterium]